MLIKELSNKDNKKAVVIILPLLFLFCFWATYSIIADRKQSLSLNLRGVIDEVKYDVKGIPEVTVANQKVYLGAGYDFDYKIQTGDTLIKTAGSNIFTLIKRETGKKLLFAN